MYLALFWAYAYALANLEVRLLGNPVWFVPFCAAAACATAGLRWRSRRQYAKEFRFRFEDQPEPAVRTLDIHFASHRS